VEEPDPRKPPKLVPPPYVGDPAGLLLPSKLGRAMPTPVEDTKGSRA
jgi:hypothetical protein